MYQTLMSWPSTWLIYHGSVIMGETHPPPQHVPPQMYMGKKAARDAERRAWPCNITKEESSSRENEWITNIIIY
jgi:hypothetical protein